jgi:hypothetical protein
VRVGRRRAAHLFERAGVAGTIVLLEGGTQIVNLNILGSPTPNPEEPTNNPGQVRAPRGD